MCRTVASQVGRDLGPFCVGFITWAHTGSKTCKPSHSVSSMTIKRRVKQSVYVLLDVCVVCKDFPDSDLIWVSGRLLSGLGVGSHGITAQFL